jgi:hypothetical protein
MSHFSIIKISIKNPDVQLLRQVVEEIAKELKAEIVNTIRDFYGNKLNVLVGIKNDVFFRGIGVRINEKGEIEIVGDYHRVPMSEVERFKQLLTQYYTAYALTSALTSLGYSVQTQKVDDKIYIRAFTL